MWKVVSDFRRYPRLIEGLQSVVVRGKGKTRSLRLRGQLVREYNVRARVTLAYDELTGGSIRWHAVDEAPPNTGRMRVDRDGDDTLVTLSTTVRRAVALPDFLIFIGLKTAITAVGEGVRKALLREKE